MQTVSTPSNSRLHVITNTHSHSTLSKSKEPLQHINPLLLYATQQLQQNPTCTDQTELVLLQQFACYIHQPYCSQQQQMAPATETFHLAASS
ncbi:hypothetical protein Nepgr_002818 [Nepenthes gracilis]|uniref:Uncharacterized protein n=1 Tax=Nepenthes gracilis TaxID=150966 RepID=A0AAD3RY21_NEPGR|nr:hypothetical protein Nepgr_002818 [Nepenthes gracilis]